MERKTRVQVMKSIADVHFVDVRSVMPQSRAWERFLNMTRIQLYAIGEKMPIDKISVNLRRMQGITHAY